MAAAARNTASPSPNSDCGGSWRSIAAPNGTPPRSSSYPRWLSFERCSHKPGEGRAPTPRKGPATRGIWRGAEPFQGVTGTKPPQRSTFGLSAGCANRKAPLLTAEPQAGGRTRISDWVLISDQVGRPFSSLRSGLPLNRGHLSGTPWSRILGFGSRTLVSRVWWRNRAAPASRDASDSREFTPITTPMNPAVRTNPTFAHNSIMPAAVRRAFFPRYLQPNRRE